MIGQLLVERTEQFRSFHGFIRKAQLPNAEMLEPPPHPHNRFGSRADIKVQIDTLQMLLNGARADFERERNFLVRHSLVKPGQNLGFSL